MCHTKDVHRYIFRYIKRWGTQMNTNVISAFIGPIFYKTWCFYDRFIIFGNYFFAKKEQRIDLMQNCREIPIDLKFLSQTVCMPAKWTHGSRRNRWRTPISFRGIWKACKLCRFDLGEHIMYKVTCWKQSSIHEDLYRQPTIHKDIRVYPYSRRRILHSYGLAMTRVPMPFEINIKIK